MHFLFPLLKNSKLGVEDRGHRLRSGSPVTNLPGAASPSYLTDSGVFPPISSLPTLSCHGIKPHIKSNTSASIQNSQVVESHLDPSSRTFKLYNLKHFISHHVQ